MKKEAKGKKRAKEHKIKAIVLSVVSVARTSTTTSIQSNDED